MRKFHPCYEGAATGHIAQKYLNTLTRTRLPECWSKVDNALREKVIIHVDISDDSMRSIRRINLGVDLSETAVDVDVSCKN